MKIVIAPDKFKESLSALEVAPAFATAFASSTRMRTTSFCPSPTAGRAPSTRSSTRPKGDASRGASPARSGRRSRLSTASPATGSRSWKWRPPRASRSRPRTGATRWSRRRSASAN